MPQFTYYASVVTNAQEYLNAYRRNNVCVRKTKETDRILLRDVPKIMGYSNEDRYAYALLVIHSDETSEMQKREQVNVIQELADKNYLPACNSLGVLIEEDKYFVREDTNVRAWYGFCHDNGYAIGTYNYARCCLKGIGGPADFLTGKKLLEEAANKGLAIALRLIGESYLYGLNGYPEYYYEARNWYHKAALQLDPYSMYNLGCLYFEGKGGKQDLAEASKWFEKAAYYDNVSAMVNYGIACRYGNGVPKDCYKAFRYFEKAANLGNTNAMYCLGRLLISGDGCNVDVDRGAKLIDKAAALGHKDAIDFINKMEEKAKNTVIRKKETYSDGSWYEGEFRNGQREGQGYYSWPDGAWYKGGFKAGQREGQGTIYWANGNKYEGGWSQGYFHGNGIFYYADGTSEKAVHELGVLKSKSPNICRENYNDGSWYEGEFRNGQRDGQGYYSWPDGAWYKGGFKDGQREGQGTIYWANGNKYEGGWSQGYFHGNGIFYYADGTSEKAVHELGVLKSKSPNIRRENYNDGSWYEGEFKNGKCHGQGYYSWSDGSWYKGEFKDGQREGQGYYSWPDGAWYKGGFKAGQREGQGTIYWANGNKYEGGWSQGYFHGNGIFYYADGTSEKAIHELGVLKSKSPNICRENYNDGSWYEGEFRNGQREGRGTFYWVNGNKYIGGWLKGNMHGTGIIYYNNGVKEEVTCDNGNYIKRNIIK